MAEQSTRTGSKKSFILYTEKQAKDKERLEGADRLKPNRKARSYSKSKIPYYLHFTYFSLALSSSLSLFLLSSSLSSSSSLLISFSLSMGSTRGPVTGGVDMVVSCGRQAYGVIFAHRNTEMKEGRLTWYRTKLISSCYLATNSCSSNSINRVTSLGEDDAMCTIVSTSLV